MSTNRTNGATATKDYGNSKDVEWTNNPPTALLSRTALSATVGATVTLATTAAALTVGLSGNNDY